MVSMRDISNACNVSIATVSKALNGHNDIGKETKERVRQKAREMGYFPNSSARALRTNRTYNLGVLLVDKAKSGLTHDYFMGIVNSFKMVAEERGYDITFVTQRTGEFQMTYLEHSRYRGFDGIMIACIDFEHPEIQDLVNSEIPVVTIDYLFNDRMAVMSNNAAGMRELVTYIYAQGHRRIAYIHGEKSAVTSSRIASFYKTLEERGLKVPEEYLKPAAYRNKELVSRCTEELLSLKEPPTCILYPDDFAAIEGMNVIKTHGLAIPDDISIAGYDGILIALKLEPRLTTIQQDTKAMGRVAAEKLVSLIEKPKSTLTEIITVGGVLIKGDSVKNCSVLKRNMM